jgi:nucleotide-binding universal stress UspA family protein
VKSFKNILYITNQESEQTDTFKRVQALVENNQAQLTIVSTADKIPPNSKFFKIRVSSKEVQSEIIEKSRLFLEELIANSALKNKSTVSSKVLVGIPYLEVIKEVLRKDVDLVIKDLVDVDSKVKDLDASDMHLLRKCPCAVWLNRSSGFSSPIKVIATLDVDDSYPDEELATRHDLNMDVFSIAASYSVTEMAELYAVHAWNAIGESMMSGGFVNKSKEEVSSYVNEVKLHAEQKLNDFMSESAEELGKEMMDFLSPKAQLLKGDANTEIPKFADDVNAELVVMGTVCRTGIAGVLIGNTAEAILNRLNCSVLAIKPKGFKSPVSIND